MAGIIIYFCKNIVFLRLPFGLISTISIKV